MWIRMSQSEAASARRKELIRKALLDALLGLVLWYVLVRLFMYFGAMPRESVSWAVGCAVVIVILPASWLGYRQARRNGNDTLVCDRCNLLKLADGQRACECGGEYFALSEMKWIKPAANQAPSPPANQVGTVA
jgi:hypothetical protein